MALGTQGRPQRQGLYNPAYERDACGVGMITHINGERSHKIVQDGISILNNLEHRGAAGADPKAGDGAGILTQMPNKLFQKVSVKLGFELPDEGEYGVGMIFMPPNPEGIESCKKIIEEQIAEGKQELLGWRRVPTDNSMLSENMLHMEPAVYQVFVKNNAKTQLAFERKLYVARRMAEKLVEASEIKDKDFFYVCSFSSRTIVYKGMFLAYQLDRYFSDLQDEDFKSAIALVHQRYSTNTFPTWGLAQPFRMIAHNGEINTLKGNINWASSREKIFASDYFGEDIKKLLPVILPGQSDSASFDNFFELLVQTGRKMEHAFAMMVPEAWQPEWSMDEDLKGFYEYHSALMEPWDGPAAMIFTDGTKIGGGLDRNGLRPIRYVETLDDIFIMASEVGVINVDTANVKSKGRLGPGMMLLIDTEEGEITFNDELKKKIATQKPYRNWVSEQKITVDSLPNPPAVSQPRLDKLRLKQRVFQYTYEELHKVVKPMALKGEETTYSMGNDSPLAVLSTENRLLYGYFKQLFAQVTNPPIDPIREELVMSLRSVIGGGYNILEESPILCRMLELPHPILTNSELEQFRTMDHAGFRAQTVDMAFRYGEQSLESAIEEFCKNAEEAVDEGYRIIVLSDRCASEDVVPIPALLAVSSVHHYLIRQGKRGKIGLIVESGEVREVHHFAMLLGYGAGAINPYLCFETITQMEVAQELDGVDSQTAIQNYIKAVLKGLKKIFSKMGISTLLSYQAAQIFEAVGLSDEMIDTYFPGTNSVVGGMGITDLETELINRHQRAYAPEARQFHKLMTSGEYAWRNQGEYHGYNPDSIVLLQQATKGEGSYEAFKKFTAYVDGGNNAQQSLRDLFEIRFDQATPISIDEVEPVESLYKRFVTGAMSIGSISKEAHEALAIAMNHLGGKSNSGEGGEDPARFTLDADGRSRRSAIKQVASGRFGVTSNYLVNADELQIKVAQGAKPGEGGQLPGFKVDEYIGKIRHTIPGVTLISPPPHHDIYSIEDLAQLIYDLKNSNDKALINVKLVAETGVGTVAAGVAKAKADMVTISGHDGGTGASPATSIKHAGLPWEIGLAETQQTLVLNNLRAGIKVQVDGQLKSGRDVIIAGLLGGEEFGFATSQLVILGCIMMRKCHLNTCPVGVATQDPELRAKFKGKPESVINFFTFLAQEVREYMAKLGVRKFEELVGQTQFLGTKKALAHFKTKGLDFSKLFVKPVAADGIYCNTKRNLDNLDNVVDRDLIIQAKRALESGEKVVIQQEIFNRNRTVGTILGSEITRKYGEEGLPEDSILVNCQGTAGQSFGAFIPKGLTLNVSGDANDYVGKGLSGGKIIVAPPKDAKWKVSANMIAGNTLLYGATSGEAYFSGLVGERFAVRNSGATAVVEGCGDHGCEYMTGGVVAVLGETGKNFAAGMSGGVAYVFDRHKTFKKNCNLSMVGLEMVEDEFHCARLRSMIEKHYELTGSKRAEYLLENWKKHLKDFVMVMPLDYRKVLAQQMMMSNKTA